LRCKPAPRGQERSYRVGQRRGRKGKRSVTLVRGPWSCKALTEGPGLQEKLLIKIALRDNSGGARRGGKSVC